MTSHVNQGWVSRLVTALGRALKRGGRAGPPPETEFEPVHGWTWRQLDDYLIRNPGYRPAYESASLRCRGPAAPEGARHRAPN